QADVISFSSGISACEKSRQWERAVGLLEQLRAAQVRENVIACNAAASACENAGLWQEDMALLQELMASLQPSVVSFSTVASACEKGGQWREAADLLTQLVQHTLQANLIAFNTVLAASRLGPWASSLQLLARLGASANTVSYGAAVAAVAAGAWAAALRVVSQSFDRRQHNLEVYNSALSACDGPIALRLLEEMQDRSVQADLLTLNTAVAAGAIQLLPRLRARCLDELRGKTFLVRGTGQPRGFPFFHWRW
ncbi:unnamed protein product, partial [Effrenium voratum]